MEYAVIMAGGSGTRLWPLSRRSKPKQLLPLIGGTSLLRLAYERLAGGGFLPPERILVCAARNHLDLLVQELPELPRENFILEPEGRDTANAVGLSSAVLHSRDPDAVVAFVTADHVIEPMDRFRGFIRTGFDVVARKPDALVTFGIVPNFGHTGLGYVHRGRVSRVPGVFSVLAFKEKPEKAVADSYVESGEYYWNSGMFVWRCDTVLADLQRYLPRSHAGLVEIAAAWGSASQDAVLAAKYPSLQKISIDFAIMEPVSREEKADRVMVVEMDKLKWLDIGSWPALAEAMNTDGQDNAVDCVQAILHDADNNVVVNTDCSHLVTVLGVSDMIIVHTDDVTMVCPKSESQRVKDLVARVRGSYGEKYM